jgi:hypothetical protein
VRRAVAFPAAAAIALAALSAADSATVRGTAGPDAIAVDNGVRDSVTCGPGIDVLTADRTDVVASDCEYVSRRLSRDPYHNSGSAHETEVEPDSYSFGRTVVAAFQVGRFADGGATNLGFATSKNGGRSWTTGFLPRVTAFAHPAGTARRASDPSVAYDAVHRVWLIASVVLRRSSIAVAVSRSRDGRRWGAPILAAANPSAAYDKEWVTCDNWTTSRFEGRCYLSYANPRTHELETRFSTDGGRAWSSAARVAPDVPDRGPVNGAQPVVRPDGTLVVVYTGFGNDGAIGAIRSTNGGVSFSAPVRIAPARSTNVPGVRASALTSADVDASGRVFVAWAGCGDLPCAVNTIQLATSANGVDWSAPVAAAADPAANAFAPGLAVDPTSSGLTVRVAIVYYVLRNGHVDVRLARSQDGGATWAQPERLDARPMQLSWLSGSRTDRMLGDYLSASFVDGRPLPVFSLAAPRRGRSLRQAVYATTRLPLR